MGEVYAGGDWWQSKMFGLSGSVGYRMAKIKEVKDSQGTVYVAPGQKYTVDYSGVFLRAAATFALTK
jgi:hypothetical protein